MAVGDMVKNVRFLLDSMETTHEFTNLIKISPKRDAMLQKIRNISQKRCNATENLKDVGIV